MTTNDKLGATKIAEAIATALHALHNVETWPKDQTCNQRVLSLENAVYDATMALMAVCVAK